MTATESASNKPHSIVIGYWDIRGLAAPIWYLCEHLKIPYRLETYSEKYDAETKTWNREEWTKVKHQLPYDFPNLPYMHDEETGVHLTESTAILVYLCNKYAPEYLGRSLESKGRVAMMESYFRTVRATLAMGAYSPELEASLPGVRAKIETQLLPVEKMLERRKTKFLVEDQLTYVDFILAEVFCGVALLNSDLAGVDGAWNVVGETKIPRIRAIIDLIGELPGVKELLEDNEEFKRMPLNNHHAMVNTLIKEGKLNGVCGNAVGRS